MWLRKDERNTSANPCRHQDTIWMLMIKAKGDKWKPLLPFGAFFYEKRLISRIKKPFFLDLVKIFVIYQKSAVKKLVNFTTKFD